MQLRAQRRRNVWHHSLSGNFSNIFPLWPTKQSTHRWICAKMKIFRSDVKQSKICRCCAKTRPNIHRVSVTFWPNCWSSMIHWSSSKCISHYSNCWNLMPRAHWADLYVLFFLEFWIFVFLPRFLRNVQLFFVSTVQSNYGRRWSDTWSLLQISWGKIETNGKGDNHRWDRSIHHRTIEEYIAGKWPQFIETILGNILI